MNARRVPPALAESLLSGVNALAAQTPVCLPAIPAPTTTTTPQPVVTPAPHGHGHGHEKEHHHGHGKHGDEGD